MTQTAPTGNLLITSMSFINKCHPRNTERLLPINSSKLSYIVFQLSVWVLSVCMVSPGAGGACGFICTQSMHLCTHPMHVLLCLSTAYYSIGMFHYTVIASDVTMSRIIILYHYINVHRLLYNVMELYRR